MAHKHQKMSSLPKSSSTQIVSKPPAFKNILPQNPLSHAEIIPLRDNITATNRPSKEADAPLLGLEVGVPADGVPAEVADGVPLVDVVTDEPVVRDAPASTLAAASVERTVGWAAVADTAALTVTPTLPHSCALNSETSMPS